MKFHHQEKDPMSCLRMEDGRYEKKLTLLISGIALLHNYTLQHGKKIVVSANTRYAKTTTAC